MTKPERTLANRICQELGVGAYAEGTPAYDAARQVWNATVDRRPLLVFRPKNVSDVQRAVDQAKPRHYSSAAVSVRQLFKMKHL